VHEKVERDVALEVPKERSSETTDFEDLAEKDEEVVEETVTESTAQLQPHEIKDYELPPIGQGLREGRLSQRYRVHAFRMSRPTMMIALEKAIQKSMTRPWRSVHHTSFL
jgi:hypothetical protein